VFIDGDIAFRVIEKDDLEDLRNLHNNQKTYLNLFNIDFVDEEGQLNWWRELYKKNTDKRYVICFAEEPKKLLGRLRIQNINYSHNNCEIGLDIIHDYRGQGYGYKSYQMVLKFLFNHFNMNMVYLKVADFNPNAKSLYKKVGFNETGKLPEYFFRYGKYWDYVIMSITFKEYLKKIENP